MATLADLVVSLTARTAAFEAEIRRARETTERHMTGIRRSAERVSGAFTGMVRGLGGLAAAFAAVGVSNYIKNTLDAATNSYFFAQQIGATTAGLTELQYVTGTTNVAIQDFNIALQRQTRRIAEAAAGAGVARGALEELGLSAKGLNALTADEQFIKLVEAMQGVESQADRVRLAFKLWDSGGVKLLRTVEMGTEGIEQMRVRARELGITIDDEMGLAAANATGAMADLGLATDSAARSFAINMAPALSEIVNFLANWLIPTLGKGIETIWALGKQVVQTAQDIFNSFQSIEKLSLKNVNEEISATVKDIIDLKERFKNITGADYDTLSGPAFDRVAGGNAAYVAEQITKLEGSIVKLRERRDELHSQPDPIEPMAKVIPPTIEGFDGLTESTKKTGKATRELKKKAEELSPALKEVVESIKEQRDEYQRIQGVYESYLDSLEDEIAQLTLSEEAYRKYKLTREGITGVMQENVIGLQQQRDALLAEKDALAENAEAQKRFVDSVAGAFDSLWSDMIQGSKSAAEAVFDTIKSLLLGIAQTILKNKIVIPIATALAPGAATAGGLSSGGGLGDLTSLDNLKSLFGGYGIGDSFAVGGAHLANLTGGSNLFAGGVNVPNWQFGIAGVAGGFVGDQLFGGYGGTGGSLGATIGLAIAGPIGAVIGTVLGGFVGGLFGDKEPSNKAAFGTINLDTLETTTGAMTGKKSPSEETLQIRDAFLETIAATVKGIEQLGGKVFGEIGLDIGERDGIQVNFGEGIENLGKDAEAAIEGIIERIVTEAEGLSEPFKQLIVLAEGVEDTLKQIESLSVIQQVLDSNPFEDYAKAVEQSQQSVWQAAIAQRDATLQLIAAYDGSVAATQELAVATQASYQAILAVIAQIDQLAQGISNSFSSSIESIQLSILDTESKYDYYRQKATEAFEALQSAVDPQEIAKAAAEFEKYANAAYGLIPEEEREEVAEEFIEAFKAAEEIAQAGFEEAREATRQAAAEMKAAIQDAFVGITAGQQQAAAAQQQAANTQLAAANTPKQIIVHVEVGDNEAGYYTK